MFDRSEPAAGAWIHANRRKPYMLDYGVRVHWTDLGEPEVFHPDGIYHGHDLDGNGTTRNRHVDIANVYNFFWHRSIDAGYDSHPDDAADRWLLLTRVVRRPAAAARRRPRFLRRSEGGHAARTGTPLYPPPGVVYPDQPLAGIAHQKLLGESIMIAVVAGHGEYARRVYLPQGRWYDFWNSTAVDSAGEWAGFVPEYRDGVLRLPVFARGGGVGAAGLRPCRHYVGRGGVGALRRPAPDGGRRPDGGEAGPVRDLPLPVPAAARSPDRADLDAAAGSHAAVGSRRAGAGDPVDLREASRGGRRPRRSVAAVPLQRGAGIRGRDPRRLVLSALGRPGFRTSSRSCSRSCRGRRWRCRGSSARRRSCP
jgi:hypothetical protein